MNIRNLDAIDKIIWFINLLCIRFLKLVDRVSRKNWKNWENPFISLCSIKRYTDVYIHYKNICMYLPNMYVFMCYRNVLHKSNE